MELRIAVNNHIVAEEGSPKFEYATWPELSFLG